MGSKRDVNGVVLLDKPTGLTSNAALQTVKHLYRARKAGHTGSLDPLATGMLPICLGEATKLSGYLLNADKHYLFSCRLGVRTATGDAEGEVIATDTVKSYTRAEIDSVLERFTGEIQQIPPMYSALKHQGKRLYALARQGMEVERKPRAVTIRSLELLDYHDDRLECTVCCSKGTYIRSLAEDIGNTLGCGAHIVSLRRTAVEPYDATRLVSLAALQTQAQTDATGLDRFLLPVDTAIASWPAVNVPNDKACYLRSGQAVLVARAPTSGWVRLYEDKTHFLGIGEILDDGRVAPRRLIRFSA